MLVLAGAGGLFGAGVLGILTPLRLGRLQRRRAAGDDVAAPGAIALLTAAVVVLGVLAGVAVLLV